MLLACCFGKPKTGKKVKKTKSSKASSDEDTYVLSNSLFSSAHQESPPTPFTWKKRKKLTENSHLSPEYKEKLYKERAELKVARLSYVENITTSTPYHKGWKPITHPFNITNIPKLGDYHDTGDLTSKDVSRMFASAEDLEESSLSVSSIQSSTNKSNQSIKSVFEQFPNKDLPLASELNIPYNSNCHKQTGFERETVEYESEIKIKAEMIKSQQEIEKDQAIEFYKQKLEDLKESQQKSLEQAVNEAKKKANETICHMNQKFLQEKDGINFMLQQEKENFEILMARKNAEIEMSFHEIEERNKVWQEEKEEIIKEVQTLKLEAAQMVSLLASEYQEENDNEERKISLGQEVYSLQLVVEMRNSEVKSLREQLARMTHQLEQSEIVKKELKNANARVEDLEEQLKIKTQHEKNLILEKSKLRESLTTTNKEVEQMNRKVETLHWKIQSINDSSNEENRTKKVLTSVKNIANGNIQESVALVGNQNNNSKLDSGYNLVSQYDGNTKMTKLGLRITTNGNSDDEGVSVFPVDDHISNANNQRKFQNKSAIGDSGFQNDQESFIYLTRDHDRLPSLVPLL